MRILFLILQINDTLPAHLVPVAPTGNIFLDYLNYMITVAATAGVAAVIRYFELKAKKISWLNQNEAAGGSTAQVIKDQLGGPTANQ